MKKPSHKRATALPSCECPEARVTGCAAAPILEARDLSFAYRGCAPVFEHVSFSLEAGDILTILGPNGAGKSTLLDCLAGISPVRSGQVMVDGEPLATLDRHRLASMLGYVSQLQQSSLDLPVRDYLVLGRAPHIGRLKTPAAADYRAVEDALAQLDIGDLADKSMGQISGGERQQVRIARALVQQPRIVMLDEPTNHLDYGNQLKILSAIDRLAHVQGMTVLLTTHTPDHAILLGGKAATLDRTGTLTVGPLDQIVTEERLRTTYGADLYLVDVPRARRHAVVSGDLHTRHTAEAR